MTSPEPITELDPRFSSEDASPVAWQDAVRALESAEICWLSTVRADGRPHVTSLLAVWLDGAAYFCTGPGEQKAKNLDRNTHCILTTGSNRLGEGLDVIIEGDAVRVRDNGQLRRIADVYEKKYGPEWRFQVRDGSFHQEELPDPALVFEVAPRKALGFGRGEQYSQTRWRFPG
jgi:nitroimidazol reductase NimA-like FMN-containing flavoprotein (pyridoxamine 5'-phosphate oxidase superfamily)